MEVGYQIVSQLATGATTETEVGFTVGSYDPTTCEWFAPPARPGSQAAARQRAEEQRTAESLVGRINVDRFCQLLGGSGGTLTCSPFRHRLG